MSATPRNSRATHNQSSSSINNNDTHQNDEDSLGQHLISGKQDDNNNSQQSNKTSHQKSTRRDPDALSSKLIHFAFHIAYPVITAPFLIGIFYIFAALRLGVPSIGWCSTRLTFNPLSDKKQHWSGTTLFILTGGLFRACPSATRNGDYAVIIFIVGLGLFFSICAPMFNIVVSDEDVVPGDSAFVPATIVGYIFAVYAFLWIGLKFSIYSRAEKARDKMMQKDRASSPRQKSATIRAQREAVMYLNEIEGMEVSVSPIWTIGMGIATSVVECALFKIYSTNFEGAAARFRNLDNEWSALTYATALFLLTSTNTMSWFGLYLLQEQAHHLTVFAEKAKLNVASANDTQVARWAVAWQFLLQEMERSPMVCSIAPACSVFLFIEGLVCVIFAVLYNLYQDNRVLEDLLPITIFIGAHSGLLLILYLSVVVRTQNVIERQHKSVSAAQNSVQQLVDAAALEADDQQLPSLRAKVRVLQSLDRYLLIADPKPKILGTSVDSFRWAIINFSLLTINVSFLLLYLVFCYQRRTQAPPTTMPPTTTTEVTNSTTSTTMMSTTSTTTTMPTTSATP